MTAALLVLVASALPASAAARSKTFRVPPFHAVQLWTRGTNHYSISIQVLDGRPQLIALSHSKDGTSVVFYRQTKKRSVGHDLDADFGTAGRLIARFVPGKVDEEKASTSCVGGPTVAEFGHFVGSFSFHGARGFTGFQAHRLKGVVTDAPGMMCRGPSRTVHHGQEPEGRLQLIIGDPAGATYFDAVTEPAVYGFPATSTYSASSERTEGTVDILDTVEASSSSPLTIPDLTATLPATTTLEPPAPFTGSAAIEAPSRRTATLSGDLAVDLPATGEVPLTGPGLYAGLCRDYACTASLPEALRPKRSALSIGIVEVERPEPSS